MQLIRAAVLGSVLLAWHYNSVFEWLPAFLLPSMTGIGQALVKIIAAGEFWPDLRVTLYEFALAFGMASTAGLLSGYLVGRSVYAVRVFDPILAGLFSVPLVILFPMFALMFGIGPASKIAIGTASAFFPIALNTIAGLTTIDRAYIKAARSMGASPSQMFFHVMLPAASPVIVTGLRIGLILSFLSIIGTEMLAAYGGLGRRIAESAEQMDSVAMFAFIVLVILVAAIINFAAGTIENVTRRMLGAHH